MSSIGGCGYFLEIAHCLLEDREHMFLTQLFLACQTVLYCSLLVKVTKPTNMNNGKGSTGK